jgi:hypothetical protein
MEAEKKIGITPRISGLLILDFRFEFKPAESAILNLQSAISLLLQFRCVPENLGSDCGFMGVNVCGAGKHPAPSTTAGQSSHAERVHALG